MIFWIFSGCLLKSVQSKNYKTFGENGVIDACLEEGNMPSTDEGYTKAKRKY